MWEYSYLQDALIRDQVVEAERRASRRHLLEFATPTRVRSRLGLAMPHAPGCTSLLHLTRLIERMVLR
jgi:hypothetical protein